MMHPARRRFGFHFVMAARRWRRALDKTLAASGLSDATWAPLMHLAEMGDGIRQIELAARVGLDTSTLVRLLDLLADRGLIERQPDPTDRRAHLIVLTPAGRAEVERLRGELFRIESGMLAEIDDDTLEAMLAAFDRIDGQAQRLLTGETDGGEGSA